MLAARPCRSDARDRDCLVVQGDALGCWDTASSIWALNSEEEEETRYARLREAKGGVMDSKTGWLELLQQPPLTSRSRPRLPRALDSWSRIAHPPQRVTA